MAITLRPTATKAAPAKKTAAKKAALPTKKAAPSRPVYDDDDDTPPRRGSGGTAARANAARSERRRARDDEEDLPGAQRGSAQAGWNAADQVFKGGEFANNLTLKDGEEVVMRFLEDQPYASMRIHWLDRKGKRSYPCPGDVKKDTSNNGCPFCAYNISYKAEARFNVAVLTEADPNVMSLTATPRNKKKIAAHHESKHGPLSRKYYFYRRTGTRFETEYSFEPARTVNDVREDYPDLYIPTEDELAELVLYTTEQANKEFAPIAEMRKIAHEIVSGEEDDDEE